jgi:hypothetical protein
MDPLVRYWTFPFDGCCIHCIPNLFGCLKRPTHLWICFVHYFQAIKGYGYIQPNMLLQNRYSQGGWHWTDPFLSINLHNSLIIKSMQLKDTPSPLLEMWSWNDNDFHLVPWVYLWPTFTLIDQEILEQQKREKKPYILPLIVAF